MRSQTTPQASTSFNVAGTSTVSGQLSAGNLRVGSSNSPGQVLSPATGSVNRLTGLAE